MLTLESIKNVIANCSFGTWEIQVHQNDRDQIYLQVVELNGIDNVTGEQIQWSSRKWFISPHMAVSELVRTAYKAVQTAMMHELDEKFKYKGVAIYDPHRNVDLLVEIAGRNDAVDDRENMLSVPD